MTATIVATNGPDDIEGTPAVTSSSAITEAQGGTVTLTSDPTGTSVCLALPLDTSSVDPSRTA